MQSRRSQSTNQGGTLALTRTPHQGVALALTLTPNQGVALALTRTPNQGVALAQTLTLTRESPHRRKLPRYSPSLRRC